jgi:hypothetical protein
LRTMRVLTTQRAVDLYQFLHFCLYFLSTAREYKYQS